MGIGPIWGITSLTFILSCFHLIKLFKFKSMQETTFIEGRSVKIYYCNKSFHLHDGKTKV